MSDLQPRSYFVGGFLLCFFGAVCFSTKAILVKVAYRDTPVDAVTLLALRMMFSAPFFVASAIVSSKKSDNVKFTSQQWFYIILLGCLGYYISSLLDFLGLQYVTAGIERLILFIYPTLVLLISSMVFKDKISSIQWLAVVVTYAGLFIAFYGEVDLNYTLDKNFYIGAVMIFVCAITYAMYIVGSGKLIAKVGAVKYNSYAMSFASVAVLAHFLIAQEESLFNLSPEIYGYSFVMAIVSTVIPSYMIAEGIKRIGSDNAAIVGSVGPVSTIIQANFFLNEPMFALQLVGTALILVGVLLISKRKKSTKE